MYGGYLYGGYLYGGDLYGGDLYGDAEIDVEIDLDADFEAEDMRDRYVDALFALLTADFETADGGILLKDLLKDER